MFAPAIKSIFGLSKSFSASAIVFVIISIVLISNPVYGQNLDKRISIDVKNESLGTVIGELARKGEILFSYNPQNLPLNQPITLKARHTTLRRIFTKVFIENGIEYTLAEKQVILKPAPAKIQQKGILQPIASKRYTISGYVRDKASGEVIIGASIYDQVSFQGTTSNAYGFYSLSLPEGKYLITNSFIGYKPGNTEIDLKQNITRVFEMEQIPIEIEPVEIQAEGNDILHASANEELKLTPSVLKQIPGFAGNMDVLKSLQNIPGIITFGDGSSYYYVRGGNRDQNLLLIDEAPIYTPAHLFGFFSALAPDAINDVTVYKGDAPSNYGGRLSSVVDVRAREGNMKKLGISGNLGPFTSDFTVEGPIVKEKSSFIISTRKSTINWLKPKVISDPGYVFNFYDLNVKLNVQINQNNRIFLTTFYGNDVYDRYTSQSNNTFGIGWNNAAGTVRWNHIFNRRLFSNTTASLSNYSYQLDISKELKNYWQSRIRAGALKTDFSYYLNPKSTFKAGFELNAHVSEPGKMYYSDVEIPASLAGYQSTEIAVYAGGEQQIGHRWLVRYGLRHTRWNDLGPTKVYFFDGNHKVIDTADVASRAIYSSYRYFEPRISMRFAANENHAVQVGYYRNVQYLQVLSNSTSPFTSLDVWVPAGPNILPQLCDMFSVSYNGKMPDQVYEFSLEAYYKDFFNQIDYRDHANLLINQLLEGELRFGKAKAWGIEALVRKNKGRLNGWISYSYSSIYKTNEEINGNKTYPASWNRPHNIGITVSYTNEKRWNFSVHWIYLSGTPFTSPTQFYYSNGYVVPVYESINNDKYPDYHRLDFSATYRINKPGSRYRHSVILTIYNAYARYNPFSVNFNKITNDEGNIVVPVNLTGDLERITSSMSVAGVIPSLNYTFRF